jgi:uncharacterized protein YecE (DUF72 family)
LLFQLPPQFKRKDETTARLESFLELLPRDLQCVFEFRDKSWFVDETYEVLRKHKAGFCAFDSPKLECPLVATAKFGYMRFHGSGAPEGGNYSDKELRRWAERLSRLAEDLKDLYVYFNNDAFGHAIRNADRLTRLLGGDAVRPGRELVAAKA